MLDHRFVRENFELVKQAVGAKNESVKLDTFLDLEKKRRDLLVKADELKHQRNVVTKEISALKKQKQDAADKITQMRQVGDQIKALDGELRQTEDALEELMRWIPNIPHESVPVGKSEADNEVVREWGQHPTFDFDPKAHWDVGEALGIMDFAAASKITGSGFILTKGLGARLERALINFFLDINTKQHGYTEIYPPFLVNHDSLYGAGQLPKLEEDMYRMAEDPYFLIPTAEVPVTNMHRDQILSV